MTKAGSSFRVRFLVPFLGVSLTVAPMPGFCADKAVDVSATGRIVIVDNKDDCKKDPKSNGLLPSATRPVRVVVLNLNIGAPSRRIS